MKPFLFSLVLAVSLPFLPACAQVPATPSKMASVPLQNGPNARLELKNLAPIEDGTALGGTGQGGRVLSIRIQNPALQGGKTPVADLEFTTRQTWDTTVQVFADTSRGRQLLRTEYGLRPRWNTVKIALDDAFFGGRLDGGFDLQIVAGAGDFAIKDLKITPYDADTNPDWSRFLRLSERQGVREVLFFVRGEKAAITHSWSNLARRDVIAKWSATLTDWNGKPLQKRDGALNIGAGRTQKVLVEFETAALPLGAYKFGFKIEVTQPDGGQKVVYNGESSFGLGSAATLGQAKPGEFLYGLDASLSSTHRNPRLMKWMDLMGVDMIRAGFGNTRDLDEIAVGLERYQKSGVTPLFMLSPPAGDDLEALKLRIEADAALIASVARRFPQIRFYELGNEPDLFGFYRGPIENYAYGMNIIAREIKTANPRAYVTNGGLSFAGDEGKTRSRRFVEVADTNYLDSLAYHAHGPLAKAEREAYDRMRATTLEFGKGHMPLVETESGVSSRSNSQDETQARTAVQKMVYAQSQKMPFFIWFRLLMFEEPYGNLLADDEPKPIILAYRHMVERLRGQSYARTLSTHTSGVDSSLFTQNGAAGAAQNATLVVWKEGTGTRQMEFELPGAKDVRLFDLYGNGVPLASGVTGAYRVEATGSPQFIAWRGGAHSAKVAAPVVQTTGKAQLLEDAPNRVRATIRNPFKRSLNAQITLGSRFGSALAVPIAPQNVALQAGQSREVEFVVAPRADASRAKLPALWTAFVDVRAADLDLNALSKSAIPASLPGEKGAATAQRAAFGGKPLDFEKLGGVRRERAVAVLVGEINAPRDQTLEIGAAADWWMAWSVNGAPVYDTLENGNGSGLSLGDHIFKLPLKKGKNRVAVQVLSGSHGWKLAIGDSSEIARVRDPQRGDALLFEVKERQSPLVLASQSVEVEWVQPIAKLNGLSAKSPLSLWQERAPSASLDAESLESEWIKTPQSQNWPRGDADLSAQIWLGGDAKTLEMLVAVRDDIDRTAPSAPALAGSDSIQIALSRGGRGFDGFILGRQNDAIQIRLTSGESTGPSAQSGGIAARIERNEAAKTTLYRLSFDRQKLGLGAAPFWINAQITDNDGGIGLDGIYAKQRLGWRGFLNLEAAAKSLKPFEWQRAVIAR